MDIHLIATVCIITFGVLMAIGLHELWKALQLASWPPEAFGEYVYQGHKDRCDWCESYSEIYVNDNYPEEYVCYGCLVRERVEGT